MNDSSSPLSRTEIGLGSKKVLIVINSLIQAGAEALVKDLAPQLRARRVQIAVAVLKRLDNSFEKLVEQAGGRVGAESGADGTRFWIQLKVGEARRPNQL